MYGKARIRSQILGTKTLKLTLEQNYIQKNKFSICNIRVYSKKKMLTFNLSVLNFSSLWTFDSSSWMPGPGCLLNTCRRFRYKRSASFNWRSRSTASVPWCNSLLEGDKYEVTFFKVFEYQWMLHKADWISPKS